jgi:hypothetical protein
LRACAAWWHRPQSDDEQTLLQSGRRARFAHRNSDGHGIGLQESAWLK